MSSTRPFSFRRHSAWRSLPVERGSVNRLAALAVFALLAGCRNDDVTVDLSTEPPADPNINQVVAHVLGLEFTTSGGGTKTLEFTTNQQLDLLDYANDDAQLRLFTSEELPEGTYTGVRLLFDTDQRDNEFVTTVAGTQFPMTLVEGQYAPISFTVKEEESITSSADNEALTLTLDLRQSLSFNDRDDEFTLTPVLRAVKTEDASRIEGNVSIACPAGDSLSQGAVYLFKGKNVTPDDVDGAGVEPFATAPIFTSQTGNPFFYALRFLPEGDYTLSVTCIGNDDDPKTDENLEFRNTVNIELDSSETRTLDLT